MVVCFPFVGDSIGGSHISSLLLIKELQKRMVEVVVLVHQDGPLVSELKRQSIPFSILDLGFYEGSRLISLTSFIRVFQVVRTLRQLTRSSKFDCVHTNDMRMHVTWAIVAAVSRVSHIWHQRTVFPDSSLARLLIRLAESRIAISNFVYASFPGKLRQGTYVIANPVEEFDGCSKDISEYRDVLMLPRDHSNSEYVIGSFGSLTEVKQPLVLVKAISTLQKMVDASVVLAIFGIDKGDFTAKMNQEAERQGWSDKLVFLGLKRPVEPWMAACDVIIATSIADGLGRSLMEAMMVGTPVIAVNSGGHKEVITHDKNGLLVPSTPDDIATAIALVLNNHDKRNELIRSGRETAHTKFGLSRHTDRILNIYKGHK
ncbi:MAG: hypothetical protein CL398_01770 [Acidiferrobacteraceae bacterium]|nr:hypothetical protein [Acidiferrobacteraceae bacterium]